MKKKTIRDVLLEKLQEKFPFLDDSLFLAESLDEAFVGIAESFGGGYAAVYDSEEIINILMNDGMTYDEAKEYYLYNILGSYMEDVNPVFITKVHQNEIPFLSILN